MSKKSQIHEEIMSFLNDYLENTPKDIIEKELSAISKKKFTGTSAQDYFLNFHQYYINIDERIQDNRVENEYLTNALKKIGPRLYILDPLKENSFNSFTPNTDFNISRKKYTYA